MDAEFERKNFTEEIDAIDFALEANIIATTPPTHYRLTVWDEMSPDKHIDTPGDELVIFDFATYKEAKAARKAIYNDTRHEKIIDIDEMRGEIACRIED